MEFESPRYDIWARDPKFRRLDKVGDFTSLTVDLKWDDMSSWSLTLPTKEYLRRWQIKDIYESLLVPAGGCGQKGAPYGVIINRNSQKIKEALLTGVITGVERDYDGFTDNITLTGECDTYFLRRREIWPSPTTGMIVNSNNWWSSDASVSSDDVLGPVESIIAYYINYNIGSWALPYRRLNYFDTYTTKDLGRGDVVQYQGKFQKLFDGCLEILHSQQTKPTTQSFGIKQVSETGLNRLKYVFLDAVDKTDTAIFGTELGTISKFAYKESLPEGNYVLVGGPNYDSGSGQTTDTAKRMYTDILNVTSADLYGRSEEFADYGGNVSGNTGSAAQELAIMADMQSQALIEANTKSYAVSAEITLFPEGPEFIKDWNIGNLVTLDLGSKELQGGPWAGHLRFNEVIREAKIDVTPGGGAVDERITPTVSDALKFSRSGGTTAYRSALSARILQNMGAKLR